MSQNHRLIALFVLVACHISSTVRAYEEEIPTECPQFNSEDTVHVAHESDCTKFYKCDNGNKVLMQCPAVIGGDQLHFNPKLQVCDNPDAAGCINNPWVPAETSPSWTYPNTSLANDEPHDRPTMDMTEIQEMCPLDGTDHCPFYPHECSCDKYYVCANGKLVLQQCKHGWHFNPVLMICEWPENAGCDGSTPPTKPITLPTEPTKPVTPPTKPTTPPTKPTKPTTPPTKPTKPTTPPTKPTKPTTPPTEPTKPTTPPTEPTKPTTPPTLPPPKCPPGSNNSWSHPKLCELYYKCENEKVVIKECDEGLHYHPGWGHCALIEIVKCNITCSCCEQLAGSISNNVQKSFAAVDVPLYECKVNFNTQIAHKKYNHLYYECRSGKKTLKECPGGYDFHPILRKCVLSSNPNCITSITED